MASLVLPQSIASGLLSALEGLLASWSRGAIRRRDALRWAFERACAETERAREREASVRAALADALERERAMRDELEDTKALVAMLEAEVVAARWEQEEIEQRARAAREEIEQKAQGISALHMALLDSVHRAAGGDDRAPSRRTAQDPVELVRFDAPPGARGSSRSKVLPLVAHP